VGIAQRRLVLEKLLLLLRHWCRPVNHGRLGLPLQGQTTLCRHCRRLLLVCGRHRDRLQQTLLLLLLLLLGARLLDDLVLLRRRPRSNLW
jgi:hypothetical protein